MQKLHLVGTTTDQRGLIFSARRGARSGGYVVTLSDDILQAIAEARDPEAGDDGDRRPPARRNKRPESSLTVREMQSRLRVGRSIEEVAAEAGVEPSWVEKFAPPVLAEQAQVINKARRMFFDKRGKGRSAEPLGDAVRRNVAERGVAMSEEEYEDAWRTHQLSDGLWLIRFRYRSRGHAQDARWEYDQVIGRVVARDRLASQLSYVQETRRRLPPPPPAAQSRAPTNGTRPTRRTAKKKGRARARKASPNGDGPETSRTRKKTRKTTARKAPAKRSTTRKSTARKTAARKTTARKAPAKRSTTRKSTARKTTTRKTTPRKATARKTTTRKTTPRKATTRKVSPRKTAARRTTARKVSPRKAAARKAARRPTSRARRRPVAAR